MGKETTYEVVCEKCGKVFEAHDENCVLCNDCWEKIIEDEGK
jgi:DNA-directed RNA polymerase subunit RPC12/RpoP